MRFLAGTNSIEDIGDPPYPNSTDSDQSDLHKVPILDDVNGLTDGNELSEHGSVCNGKLSEQFSSHHGECTEESVHDLSNDDASSAKRRLSQVLEDSNSTLCDVKAAVKTLLDINSTTDTDDDDSAEEEDMPPLVDRVTPAQDANKRAYKALGRTKIILWYRHINTNKTMHNQSVHDAESDGVEDSSLPSLTTDSVCSLLSANIVPPLAVNPYAAYNLLGTTKTILWYRPTKIDGITNGSYDSAREEEYDSLPSLETSSVPRHGHGKEDPGPCSDGRGSDDQRSKDWIFPKYLSVRSRRDGGLAFNSQS